MNSREQSVRIAQQLRTRVARAAAPRRVLQRRPHAPGAARGRARVPRRRPHRGRRHERVRRGRQHPGRAPRRALPPAVQRGGVQPDVRPRRARRRVPPPCTCSSARGRAAQRDDPRVGRARARRPRAALPRAARPRRASRGDDGFEITNAELAERVKARRPKARLTDKGVSAGLGVFRELGLVDGRGRGRVPAPAAAAAARRASSTWRAACATRRASRSARRSRRSSAGRSTRPSAELLERFNRPILPSA